jgi:hypothetical protein
MRPSVTFYDTNRDYAYASATSNNNGDNLYFAYKVPVAGMYYLRVTDANGAAHTTPYTLAVSGGTLNYEPPFAPATQEAEPNNVVGQANDIPLAQNIAGAINPANDYDWFRFSFNAPGIVTLSHTGIPAAVRSEMWVYNADISQIGYRLTTNKGEDNVLTTTVDQPGYGFVRLRDNSSTGSGEAYTLRVDHVPVVDGHEPNNAYGTATPLARIRSRESSSRKTTRIGIGSSCGVPARSPCPWTSCPGICGPTCTSGTPTGARRATG